MTDYIPHPDDLCACGQRLADVSFAHYLACGEPPDGITQEFADDFAAACSDGMDRYFLGSGPAIFGEDRR